MEPDDPNQCPYQSKEDFFEHIQEQAEWKAWRSAPVDKRGSHALQMAKRFNPDKYDVT